MADIFSIGRSGLSVSKKALETTSHNISNVNTEGYSRQRTLQQANAPHLKSGVIMGTGADVKAIKRVHDQFVENRLQSSLSEDGFYNERSIVLKDIEQIFNEADGEGLNQILTKFFNSFRELANNPEDESIRSLVRDNAIMVSRDFRRARQALDDQSINIDRKVETFVEETNSYLNQITKLNQKIRNLEVSGNETGDLRDDRDRLLKRLSEYFKIHHYEDNRGNFNVNIDGVGTIVSGVKMIGLRVGRVSKENSLNNMEGSLMLYFEGRPSNPITHKFRGGRMEALIKTRNEDLQKLQSNLDKIAFQLSKAVNNIHNQGFASRSVEVSPDGSVSQSDDNGPLTGINFFENITQEDGASHKIFVSEPIQSDLTNIATGLAPNKPGDNRVAIAISKLQHQKILHNNTTTFEEEYLKSIADIGLKAGKADIDQEQAKSLLTQMETIRERISGVSIDEEASNLIRYQRAFDASARVMRTAGELFDTVLGIMP
ncbi:MAG: flagellar hook-associated protein FlgK [Bacteriovoracaceae bacterium]